MKVEEFLQSQGVEFEKHAHPTTYTAQGLAHAEHVSGYEVAKPVVVRGKEKFAMCVLPAPNHLDRTRVARALHEDSVRLATEAEMVDLFPDCELGAEPPIGSMFGMSTVMDAHLIDDDYVIMQAGTHRDAVRVRREDWQRVCDPIVADICLS
jgi:Ala-tRNA(Pro) deacylase